MRYLLGLANVRITVEAVSSLVWSAAASAISLSATVSHADRTV
jgi:hypothetical protein